MHMISVIIPAYNAESTIEKTLSSITGQSYSDFEIIVVNDGSTDGTASVVSKAASMDSRIRLVSINNSGPANARNVGLSSVSEKSDYIMFCDADDEFLPGIMELSLSQAEKGADVVIFGFRIINSDGTQNEYFEPYGNYDISNFGSVYSKLYKANLLNQVWGKLISAKLIYDNNISFPDYRWGEDRLFLSDCLEKSESISVIPECGYLYIIRKGESLISGYYDKKIDVCIEIDKRIKDLCSHFYAEYDGTFRYMFAKSIFSAFANLYSPSCKLSYKEKCTYIDNALKNKYVSEACSDPDGGRAIKVICALIKSKNPRLNSLAAKSAYDFGNAFPKVFQKIKHKK